MDFKTITVQEGQNIYDIAVQEYGGVDAVEYLQTDNPTKIQNLNATIAVGDTLLIRKEAAVERPQYMRELRKRRIFVISNQD
jgi:hypothetical protein